MPFQVNGQCASSTGPETWNTFEAISPLVTDELQPGFVFSVDDPFCGIDLDGCRNPETGEVQQWAREIILKLDSYAEVSPSGTGLKCFVRAALPGDCGKKREVHEAAVCDKKPGIEVYDHGRYFAVTGQKLKGVPSTVNERQGQVDALVSRFWPDPVRPPAAVSAGGDVVERARKYVSRMPPAISGSKGHDVTFHAACVVVLGFGLSDGDAMAVMQEYNSRCQPAWSERELQHKIRQADKQGGERNYLRDARQDDWHTLRLPAYAAQLPEPTTKVTTLQSSVLAYIDKLSRGEDVLITTGIVDLDYAFDGGWAEGEMILMAARPSHGKSAVALQCVHHWTANGHPSLFVSEEMASIALGKRTLHSLTDMPRDRWRENIAQLGFEQADHFANRAPCFIVENCRRVETVVETVERHVKEDGVKCVVLDYAQLLKAAGSSRYEQITNVSIALAHLKNSLGIVLLALCQMSRDIESRDKFVPQMSDIKDSGQLEQDADCIVFNVWPHRVNPSRLPGEYEFYLAKSRSRGIKKYVVSCIFDAERQRILNAADPNQFEDPFADSTSKTYGDSGPTGSSWFTP